MEFSTYKQIWSFAINALKGDGGFLDGSFLDKFPRESENKYKNRQKISYYTNLIHPNINRYIGYLFKNKPVRVTNNKLIKQILDDVDNKGNSIDVFMSSFAKYAKIRGVGIVLVDMFKELPNSLDTQIKDRILPYLIEIDPSKIISYKLDKSAKFDFVMFEDILDNPTLKKEDKINIKRYYDKDKWVVYDKDDNVIDSGFHNLGVCPVLFFSEDSYFPTVSEFTQIANLAKRHYNLKSELDDILRNQTFSILAIQAETDDDVSLDLSIDNAIIYAKDTQKPSFIAPEVNPANIYQNEIKEIEKQINQICYNINTNLSSESGIALDIKFQGLNSSLNNFALRLEDFELKVFDVIFKYLKQNFDIDISYSKSFNIIDIGKEINTLSNLKEMNYNLKNYEKAKLMQIINNDLNSVSNDMVELIRADIEDNFKDD